MKALPLNDDVAHYQRDTSALPQHHALLGEIAARLIELDELPPMFSHTLSNTQVLVHRLNLIQTHTEVGYRLLLDLLSRQESMTMRYDDLAARHSNGRGGVTTRANWLQNAQNATRVIEPIWPEVAQAMAILLKRQHPQLSEANTEREGAA